ncbi:MAG TPA: DbpA RNA binding domain-containing protein [Gemmatimonadaceae bacterium]|nr:DbpA RNA binding domain-containing protein [Gemmatimonadaceae bacterium]
MLESEDIGERASTQAGRAQNLVYTLPYTTDSIAEFLTPALGRVDPSAGGTQVVVVTRDPETALTISETILRISGAGGIEVVPVTSAARAGRLFKSRPVLAVAGTAAELSGLVRASLLKLETVRTVVLAWADDILDAGPESVASLEALLGELGEASRVIVARKTTPPIDDLIERYARRSRRVGLAETEAPQIPENYEFPILRYLTVGGSARPAALRRLLDDLDPPSTLIVARDASSVETAGQTVRTLGYHPEDPAVRVTRDDFTSPAHTVIFYQPPVTPAELQRSAQVKPVQIIVLAQPGEVAWLRELASGRLAPINLHGAERRAHDREESVRQELRAIVTKGVPPREIISLEPLLHEFDAAELAAAALHLLERERAQRRAAAENPPTAAKPRPSDGDRGAAGGMTRLFMTIGTRDGVKTGDLMGAIAGEGGIPGDHVGKIDLRESHALVEVASADAASVIERVNGKMIKGRRVVVRGERDKEDRERSAGPRPGSDRGGSDRPRRSGPPDRGGSRDRGSFDRDRGGSRGGPPNRSGRGGPPDRKRDRS